MWEKIKKYLVDIFVTLLCIMFLTVMAFALLRHDQSTCDHKHTGWSCEGATNTK